MAKWRPRLNTLTMVITDPPSTWLTALIGAVDHRTEIAELWRRLERQPAITQRRILNHVVDSASDLRTLKDEHSRVFLARVLVALVPQSLDAITTFIEIMEPAELQCELQFSLFVALSDLPALVPDPETLDRITRIVEEYLFSVRTDSAQAAWMAGDLLGDHWPVDRAFPALVRVARLAEFDGARRSAIHGLSHMLASAPKRRQWEVVTVLRDIAEHDSNERIRTSAESAIGSQRGL